MYTDFYYIGWSSEDVNKRRSFRSRVFRDAEKPFSSFGQDRNTKCKFSALKLVLVIIVFGALLTLLRSPAVYNTEHHSSLDLGMLNYIFIMIVIAYYGLNVFFTWKRSSEHNLFSHHSTVMVNFLQKCSKCVFLN